MEIAVLLFGTLKDVAGTDRIAIHLPATAPATVSSLLDECKRQHPKLEPWLPHLRVAVNLEYAHSESTIVAGDEVAFIPPVAGGSV